MLTKRPKTAQRFAGIDVTALGSVLLALVFLMVCLRLFVSYPHHRMTMALPIVNNPSSMNGADRDDALVVTITRNRIYYFGSERISIEALPMKIQDGIAHGAERKIYIRADARAKYKDIKAVVDAIHQSGIENVGFLVDPRLSQQQKASSRFRGPHY